MWYYDRPYGGEADLMAMCSLIAELNHGEGSNMDWTVGRVIDWRYGLWNPAKLDEAWFGRNCRLWYDRVGKLAGFALSEDGRGDYAFFARPEYAFLYGAQIAWAEGEFGPKLQAGEELTITVADGDEARRAALLRAAYADRGHGETTALYAAGDFRLTADEPLPPGYLVLGMDEFLDQEAQIDLKNDAFRDGAALDAALAHAFRYVKRSPIYDPSMDLVLTDGRGLAVAGCEGFMDYENGVVEVERVCTRRGFRNRGFAGAVIRACVARALTRGARFAQISGLNERTIRLYGSFGPHRAIRRSVFTKSPS